jgi:hypothetical protein
MAKVPDSFGEYAKHADNFGPVPAGDYWMTAVNQVERDTRDGAGSLLHVEFMILRSPYKNRRVFMNFNIGNKSGEVRDVAWGQVYGWARACGIENIKDTSELKGREFKAHLIIEEPKDPQYRPQNKVQSFISRDKAGDPAEGNKVVASRAHNSGAQPPRSSDPPPTFEDDIVY